MTEKRKTPAQGRSRHTVEALLEATAQVLVSDGYARLTTTRVAERAGVSVGTLYQYFPAKQSLIVELAERTLARAVAEMTTAAQAAGSPEERVRALIAALLRVKNERSALSLVLPAAFLEVAGRQGLMTTLTKIEELVTALLGELAPDADARTLQQAAFVVVHAVDGVINGILGQPDGDLAAPELHETLVVLVLGYLERVGLFPVAVTNGRPQQA